ncbi:MAG: T9SS type A sorting domain-containing protein [Bacteroidia bacterium]|nr:T9SS type A sorting domain-containing protein [Bacteroidia bacterium]
MSLTDKNYYSFSLFLQVCLFTALIILSGCEQLEEEKMFPSDYLFAQRSFPYNKVDLKAYKAAVKNRNNYANLKSVGFNNPWQNKGPFNFDGRVTDLELHPENDNILYAGSASGGISKSVDGGEKWRPIFDQSASLSIGDLSLYKNDPDIIYAGTGESNAGGGSLAYDGLGVYKTIDGGENWNQVGLTNVGSIGKVVIDPNNSDVVFVAAMGALFKNTQERGVYRTTDGGDSWENVLMVSDSTGAIDLAMHPNNGNIIYAAMWERIRRPHNRQYGGATSGLYKSEDGGETWTELINGLPTESNDKGRIGIAISESHPNILYAYYMRANGQINGIYKTEDGGTSWVEKSKENITSTSYNWWFGKIFIDPKNPNKLFVTSLQMFASEDGAESWTRIFNGTHVDQHAAVVGNNNNNLVFIGNDGGVYKSEDNGSDYNYMTGLGNYQFYTCEFDPINSSRIYGGAQDNGILTTDGDPYNWNKIFGGDGFRIIVDPSNNDLVYFEYQYGNMLRLSLSEGTPRSIISGLFGRFNWNTPIAMDPNNTNVLYTGAQNLFRTEDNGDNWEAVSEPLNDPTNPTGNLTFGSLTTIDVSGHDSKVIYAGADDGSVWVSKDYGTTYNSINDGLPKRWITSIVHDPHFESGVYVTVSGFRFGESDAQVFYSDDFGENWNAIGSNLPDVPLNDILPDPSIEENIYVASDIGVFYSENNGTSWEILGTEMPIVPIIDLDIHEQDRMLAAASFGRGIYTYELPEVSSNKEALIGNSDIIVFPTITDGLIQIQSKYKIQRVSIITSSGQHVSTIDLTSTVDLSGFENGIYYLSFNINDKMVIRKVIKQ